MVSDTGAMDNWLEQLQSLADELECGMQALAADRIDELEQSIHRQKTLCMELRCQTDKLPDVSLHSPAGEVSRKERGLAARIRSASAAVDVLNRRYAALLRHSGRFLQMSLALERGNNGDLPPAFGSLRPERHTWSCEG